MTKAKRQVESERCERREPHISPEMIDAGVKELWKHLPRDIATSVTSDREVVERVLEAALRGAVGRDHYET